MTTPVPVDPMIGKMKKLRAWASRHGTETKLDLVVGERIGLAAWNDEIHRGTISRVEAKRFRVSWDREIDGRGKRLPRQRLWYTAYQLPNFIRNIPD